ncbi:hypothetical protein M8745_20660, partial [Lutimaribacter sp. EGI FJ00014]|nr:hypothetical protein [Lutimaribacter sp. EGI FJ00014]
SSLGGSTTVNALIMLFPQGREWQRLVELTGDSGWSAEAMRERFRRLEKIPPVGIAHVSAFAIRRAPSLLFFPLDRSAYAYPRITYKESEVIRLVQRGRGKLSCWILRGAREGAPSLPATI